MTFHAVMRQCLETLDTVRIQQVWKHVAPHLPQPSEADVLKTLHMARTSTESLPLKARAYSHAWLNERGLPSLLPDRLKKSAERLYPVTVGAVGIAVRSQYEGVGEAVRSAMETVVSDCYANGDDDPKIIKPRMMEARDKEKKALFGLKRR